MTKYYIRDNGLAYCEGPENEMLRFPDAVEVPQRPSEYHKWEKSKWVYSPELYTEYNSYESSTSIKEAEEQKKAVTNLTAQELSEIDDYIASIKVCMVSCKGDFPVKPDCLQPERIWQ